MQSSFSFFILLLVGLFSESNKKRQKGGGDVSSDGIGLDVSQPDLATESLSQIQGDPITMADTIDAVQNTDGDKRAYILLFALSLVSFFSVIGLIVFRIYQRVAYA
jgi:hypothetical protein